MHILIKCLLIFVSKASPSSHPTASLLPSLPGSELISYSPLNSLFLMQSIVAQSLLP